MGLFSSGDGPTIHCLRWSAQHTLKKLIRHEPKAVHANYCRKWGTLARLETRTKEPRQPRKRQRPYLKPFETRTEREAGQ